MGVVTIVALIYSFFATPQRYNNRVLFWDNLGVDMLRAALMRWTAWRDLRQPPSCAGAQPREASGGL